MLVGKLRSKTVLRVLKLAKVPRKEKLPQLVNSLLLLRSPKRWTFLLWGGILG